MISKIVLHDNKSISPPKIILEQENEEIREILNICKKYIKQANSIAESKYDGITKDYMDYSQYEIIRETENILVRINAVLLK